MTEVPNSWAIAPIVDVLALNENGKPFQQGWSPQCENHPASDEAWGVLKTTAIQPGQFWGHENKHLPEALDPRPHIEVREGDLLMTCAGPRARCGVVCLVEHTRPRLMMSGKMYRFRPNPEVMDPRFLTYFIQSRSAQVAIDAMKTGISDSGLNLTHDRFATLSVPVAPPAEQCRIVAKIEELFSELDKGIESLTTAREQLKAYRQSVLKDAFEGGLTASWRSKRSDKTGASDAILARIRAARENRYSAAMNEWQRSTLQWRINGEGGTKPSKPERFIEQPSLGIEELRSLPPLPSGWTWVRLGELFSSSPQNGLYKPASNYGTGTPIIRIDSFYDGAILRDIELKRLALFPDEIEKYAIEIGDLLINRVNSIEYLGKCALVAELQEATVFESNIMKCSIMDSHVNKSYIAAYLTSHSGKSRLCRNAKHAVNQASINQTDVALTPVPLPPLAEQIEIVSLVEAALSQAMKLTSEIELQYKRATVLRQAILKRAFSGQLVSQDASDEPVPVLLERIRTGQEGMKERRNNKNGRKEAA